MLRREMQAGIASVIKVWIFEIHGVVAHDALHKIEVVEENSTAQTPRYVNPVGIRSAESLLPLYHSEAC